MYLKYMYILTLLVLLIFSACATSQFGWQQEPVSDREESKSEKKYKEDFDPLLLKEAEIVVVPAESRVSPQRDIVALHVEEVPEASIQTEISEVPGYCIQLFATEDEARAREFKKQAMFKLSSDVYWVFESGMYKIRTGNRQTRKEAELVLQEIKQKGHEFGDAWIVKTRVQLEVPVSE